MVQAESSRRSPRLGRAQLYGEEGGKVSIIPAYHSDIASLIGSFHRASTA
jgi:hypothetical protein